MVGLSLAWPAAAQARIGKAELAHARELLDRSRKDLSPEQWALLSARLAEAEVAFAELTTAGGGTAAVVAEGSATALAALEVLPLLVFFWPATAHAPGMKESAARRAARTRFENSLRDLAQAAHQIEGQRTPAMEAKLPLDDKEDCQQFAEGHTGGPERHCHYNCGKERICIRVDGSRYCPYGPGGPGSIINFGKLARFPRCPPLKKTPD